MTKPDSPVCGTGPARLTVLDRSCQQAPVEIRSCAAGRVSVFTQGTLEVGAPVEIATASVVVLAEVLSITPGEGGYLAIMRVEHALDLEEMAAIGRAWDEAGIAGERSMEPSLSRLLAGLYTPDARGHDQDEPKTDQVQVSRDSTS